MTEHLNPIANNGNYYVVRCKENRKYCTTNGLKTINDLCKKQKVNILHHFNHQVAR